MNEKSYRENLAKDIDEYSHFNASSGANGNRTFTIGEIEQFTKHMWEERKKLIDITDEEFIMALVRTRGKFDSAEQQAKAMYRLLTR